MVAPLVLPDGRGVIQLSSTGRSTYRALEVSADLPADAIHFDGALKWVGELQKSIPTGLFGGGLSLDVQPAGVCAGYTFALPPIDRRTTGRSPAGAQIA